MFTDLTGFSRRVSCGCHTPNSPNVWNTRIPVVRSELPAAWQKERRGMSKNSD